MSNTPLAVYKLELDKFDPKNEQHQKLFKKHFGNYSIEELKEINPPYLVIDEYSNVLALPQYLLDPDLYKRFIVGPKKFTDHNKLFEYFETHRRTNKHYFIIPTKKLSLRQKLLPAREKIFRKFYTENSGFFHPQVEFLEVEGFMIRHRLGVGEGDVYHFTNDIPEIRTQGEKQQFYSLDLVKNIHEQGTTESKLRW